MANNNAPILLAEDDENDVFLLQHAFESAGVSSPLMVVRNGQEAIWYLAGERIYADRTAYPWPHLLLLDLKMPLMDGFDVLTWVQKRRPKNLLVVVLSSSRHEADIRRALDLGAHAYWVKPHDFNQLIASVRELHAQISQFPTALPLMPTRRYEERL